MFNPQIFGGSVDFRSGGWKLPPNMPHRESYMLCSIGLTKHIHIHFYINFQLIPKKSKLAVRVWFKMALSSLEMYLTKPGIRLVDISL